MNDTPTPVIPIPPTVRRLPAPSLGRRRPEVLVRLEQEWRTLTDRPSTRRRVASWGLAPWVRTLDDALVATGWREFRRPSAGGAPSSVPSAIVLGPHDRTPGDAAARCLLVAARTDDLAARVLLQRMLPGLCTAARRWRRRADDGWAPIDELVATAWSVIRTFPFETRPSHLVANLLRDTEYQAYRKTRRRLLEVVPAGVPEEWDWPGASRAMAADPADETLDDDALLELARVVARVEVMRDDVLDDSDRVVLRLLAAGLSLAEAAEQLGCTSRTVQNHRLRLVHRLRAALVV